MNPLTLGYVVVFVPDVAVAVEFYGRAFGLAPAMQNPAFATLQGAGTAIAFGAEFNERKELPQALEWHRNRPEAAAAGVQLSFVAADVRAAFDRAVEAGCTPVVAPKAMPWGQTISRVRDLNGVLVSLVSPPPGG